MTAIHIDDKFRLPVRNHMLANLLTEIREFPLILGIFGPPGEGKTFQVEAICAELNFKQRVVSPGELESENAGAPGQLLRSEYLKASADTESGRPSVIVVHDLDTVLGHWGDLVQYTVNRQVVFAQLMAFCDNPYEVAGKRTVRVPIIATGNNPSILHGPVLRPGRARLLLWKPDPAARFAVVRTFFPGVDEQQIRSLLAQYADQPVAFWADVRAVIIERRVARAIDELRPGEVHGLLAAGKRIRVPELSFTYEAVHSVVENLAASHVSSSNFLTAI